MKEFTREQMVRTFYRPTREEIGRHVPTADEMASLLSILPRSSSSKIVASLAARTGIRLGEALAIRAGEIDEIPGTVWVGSGAARRKLRVDSLMWNMVVYTAHGKNVLDRLIPISRQAVTQMLKRYGPWSYNDLRAGFAAEYLVLGGDILALSVIMGIKPASVCKLVDLRPPAVDVVEVVSPL